jgi:nucleoside 2-deoxyribosyltransferase
MFAFVLMPFDSTFEDIYKLGIKETAEKLGVRAERVDEQIFHKENILERIYGQIDTADFIIADMTGRNPNVFYEVGYAHAKGKTCLLLTSKADDIPFDLKHHRHIIYGDSIQNLRRELETELTYLKSEVANRKSIIAVKLNRIDGLLVKDSWSASAEVELHFDLTNKTTIPSPEIEAIYFNTGKGWDFTQDGQPCASRQTNGAPYSESHFIKPPVRRLQANSWANIAITGKKILEVGVNKTFKDKYKVAGRALIQIVTSEGTFDFPVDLDVDVDEYPF